MAAKLETLQKKIAELEAQYRANVADAIRETMDAHGITVDDLKPTVKRLVRTTKAKTAAKTASKAKPKTAAKTKASPLKGRKLTLVPKYRNPETGETWTGHARPPAWIRDVKDREQFRIAQ